MTTKRTHKYRRVIAAVYNTAWAITIEKFQQIVELLELRRAGARLTTEEIRERIGYIDPPDLLEIFSHDARSETIAGFLGRHESVEEPQPISRVAVINVFGTISQRMNGFEEFSGGTSTEQLAAVLRETLADESIGTIILNIDSPGGRVAGVSEVSDLIFESRGEKPIIALANPMIASAAYWIAASADEIVATPSAESIGSIGTLQIHREDSKMIEDLGSKFTIIKSVEFKAEGNPYEELPEAARKHFQDRIDAFHKNFVSAVARGRGVTAAVVDERFGQGRSFPAAEAVERGLADRIATFEELLAEFGVGPNAEADQPGLEARHRPVVGCIERSADDPRNQSIETLVGAT